MPRMTSDRDEMTTRTEARVDDLCLGRTSPKKVVHHEGCRHAKAPYNFARRYAEMGGVGNFAYELVGTGAWRWHHFCQACCGDVDDEVRAALRNVEEAIGEPYV